jgi:hypothetical protein
MKRIERRPTAVLTLFNRTPDPGLDWVGSALPELLTSRLAELPELRVFPRQTVGLAEFSLGIPNAFALDERLVERLNTGLGSELTLAGRYELDGKPPRGRLRVVLQLYDVRRKGAVATVSEPGEVDGLRDLARRLAEDLRLEMGWELAPPGERDFLRSPIAADPLPADLEATRLYSEALSRLWRVDGHGALQRLKAARGWKAIELEARLEYGKAQRTAGNGPGATRTLASVEGEATPLGMLLLARHAREARQGH